VIDEGSIRVSKVLYTLVFVPELTTTVLDVPYKIALILNCRILFRLMN